jgi:biotin synthase
MAEVQNDSKGRLKLLIEREKIMVSAIVNDIVKKVFDGEFITSEVIKTLLQCEHHSVDAGFIMAAANTLNRQASGNRAEVHAQIGLNCSPCPRNCLFCAFAARNMIFTEDTELPLEDAISMAKIAEHEGANAIFIMATGDYPMSKYLDITKEIRSHIKPETVMIANVGDFNYETGKQLKDAGFTGIYHAVRMGEGKVTGIAPETRLKTAQAAREAGLLIGTCVEPVGPEHDIDEIVEKIIIGRDIKPTYSGAARRITIPGTELEKFGMLTEYQMAFLVAVTRLAMGRNLMANCTHEPNLLGANAGANLFWAEVGTNPRDTEKETSEGRGMDVYDCAKLFKESDYSLVNGASIFYSQANKI